MLSLEVSRLARSCSDWYRLIEICGLSNTLVIDEEGIYDPNQYNDRLLLGFKGTMSEAELHWLHSRLQGGKLEKAQKGDLRFRLPSGLVYDPLNHIILDPDEQVQQAVRLVFDLFDQFGSAMAVVQYFNTNQLLFPTRFWGGTKDGELIWQALSHGRMLAILHNPAYADTEHEDHAGGGGAPHLHALRIIGFLSNWHIDIVICIAHHFPDFIT